jgi:hypothetical protein
MIAKNIIEDDESAIVFSTDGKGLKIFDGGFATTGDWLIDRNLAVDKAIIYKRDKLSNRTEIFLGKPLDVFPSTKNFGRYIVRLSDVSFVGTTENNWCEFTESKKGATNPIKYINKNNSKTLNDTLLSLSENFPVNVQ